MKAGRRRHRPKADPDAAFKDSSVDPEELPADVHAEALRCRAEYAWQCSEFTGSRPPNPGKKTWPTFVKAARAARARGLTPEIFVAAVLERAAVDGFFRPQALTSERYVNQGMGGLELRKRYRLGLYRAQLDRFTALLRFGPAASILQAFGPEFVPLLRYVMATRFNEPALAGSSRDVAYHELLIHPEGREVFGHWLEEPT